MTFFLFFCKKMHFLVRYSNNIFLSIWKLILTLRNTVFFYDLIAGPPTFLWKNVFDLHFPFNTKGSRTVCPKRAFYALNHTLLYPFVRYSRYGLGFSLRTWSDGIMSLRTLLLHRLRLDKMLHIFSSLNGTTKTTIPGELKMKAFSGRQWLYFQTTHHI